MSAVWDLLVLPPAVGTVAECKERCRQYTGGFIFTTVAEVSDIENMKEMLDTRKDHEEITRQIRRWWNSNVRKR